jgi:ribosome-binding protein aMBF1 (putative translation factor)
MLTITKGGKKFVLVPIKQWEKITVAEMPPIPEADAEGNVPAVAYAQASIARQIISERTALGLSQAELARRAGIRVETLNRIEKAKVVADTATIVKIEAVLKQVEKRGLGRFIEGGEVRIQRRPRSN